MSLPTVIVIAGPTASGKTALAVALAKALDTVIISADARQCFRELNLGVAKPTEEQLAAVPHYFINSHSVHDTVNAALFEKLALKWAESIFLQRSTLVVAGGAGLYINAFCDGLDQVPVADPALREEIRSQYAVHGLEWLQHQIRLSDPDFASRGEMKNPHRLQRALEVVRQTGRSILSYHGSSGSLRKFNVLHFALHQPRETLIRRIDDRVDGMIRNGLVEEAERLYPIRELPALQTVGYQEFFPGPGTPAALQQAIGLVKQHTRQYAKRQLTWFRRDKRYEWLEEDPLTQILTRLRSNQPE